MNLFFEKYRVKSAEQFIKNQNDLFQVLVGDTGKSSLLNVATLLRLDKGTGIIDKVKCCGFD